MKPVRKKLSSEIWSLNFIPNEHRAVPIQNSHIYVNEIETDALFNI